MSGRSHATNLTHKIKGDGEVTVNLVLTIKLDSDGLSLTLPSEITNLNNQQVKKNKMVDDEDDVSWEIPNIESDGIIDFGKKE